MNSGLEITRRLRIDACGELVLDSRLVEKSALSSQEPTASGRRDSRKRRMLNTLGIVQVRQGSAWCSSKIGRKLGGKSLLEWVVRRLSDCQRLDSVLVVLGDSPADHAIRDLVPPAVPVFVG